MEHYVSFNTCKNIKYISISTLCFCICSTMMSTFGDALAWYRMPKYDSVEEAEMYVMKDAGFELIPYSCPRTGGHNVQTYIIIASVIYSVGRCLMIRNGIAILQRMIHISCIMLLIRMVTLNMTALPNPNPLCVDESMTQISYFGAGGTVSQILESFPPKTCGNLMFSGHTMFLTIFLLFETFHGLVPRKLILFSIAKTLAGYHSTIACRSHYTIDVMLAILFTNMVFFLHKAYFPKRLELPIVPRMEMEIPIYS